jgi:hypothetical protein
MESIKKVNEEIGGGFIYRAYSNSPHKFKKTWGTIVSWTQDYNYSTF